MKTAWNKKTRVLIADDNESDRMILRSMLIALGFAEIHEAEDGVQAESKINVARQIKTPFEIVFVDWMMPKLNGLKLLQHLRSEKAHEDMVLIMTTSKSHMDAVTDAARAGVNEYIVKPLTLDVLRMKLEKHLSAPPQKAK